MDREREFEFTDRDFDKIRQIVNSNTGISLSDAKQDLVYSRLSRRLRVLGINNFKNYCDFLQDDGNDDEMVQFTNALTTNLTSFFREPHHFEYLKSTVFPELKKQKAIDRRIRIWSSACSTGEEPYSIAITAKEAFPTATGWDVKILATDLDSNVVAKAKNGIYEMDRVKNIKDSRVRKWFKKNKSNGLDQIKASSELQNIITFKQLNLMHAWPMKGPFDIIFCRNVVIYFDKPTQKILFDRMANLLAPGGYLFLGHSETLFKITDRFDLIGNTIYKKIK